MTEKEAILLNKLHGASGWLKRAQKKYLPTMENMSAEGNRAFFNAEECLKKAIDILVGGGKDGNNASG